MAHPRSVFLFSLSCITAASLAAQTQIGGGTCNSATISGSYSVTLTGRQVTGAGAISAATFSTGTVTVDGQSGVQFMLTGNTNAGVRVPLNYSGTYSVQANCQGTMTLTTGDSITFSLIIYNQGNSFQIVGHDATYTYSGGGSKQPSNCLLATLTGVYALTGTGYTLSGSTVTGVTNLTGLAQFDGQGNLTVNLTESTGAAQVAFNATGSYSVAPTCVATATLTDPQSNQAAMSISINNVSGADFQMILGDPKFSVSGSGHMAFGS